MLFNLNNFLVFEINFYFDIGKLSKKSLPYIYQNVQKQKS